MSIKGRITLNKLKDWVNEEFAKLGFTDWECHKIERTYYTRDQYECGAAHLLIFFQYKDESKRHSYLNHYFYCFYPIWYIQKEVNQGTELILKMTRNGFTMKDLEIDFKKSNTFET